MTFLIVTGAFFLLIYVASKYSKEVDQNAPKAEQPIKSKYRKDPPILSAVGFAIFVVSFLLAMKYSAEYNPTRCATCISSTAMMRTIFPLIAVWIVAAIPAAFAIGAMILAIPINNMTRRILFVTLVSTLTAPSFAALFSFLPMPIPVYLSILASERNGFLLQIGDRFGLFREQMHWFIAFWFVISIIVYPQIGENPKAANHSLQGRRP